MLIYYYITAIASTVFTLGYFSKLKKGHDIYMSGLFLLMTISEIGMLLRASSWSLESALTGNIIGYIGGCFTQQLLTFTILTLCRIKWPRAVTTGLLLTGAGMYALIITNSSTNFYYKNVDLVRKSGTAVLQKTYGPGHTLFYIVLIVFFIMDMGILLYSSRMKKDASIKNINICIGLIFFNVSCYFLQRLLPEGVEVVAATYVITQAVLLHLMDRFALYNIDNTVAETLLNSGELGCFSFAKNKTYLGCSDQAKAWIPDLGELRVDCELPRQTDVKIYKRIRHWMKEIDLNKEKITVFYTENDVKYKILGSYLRYGKDAIVGYQFTISDYTSEQRSIDLINNYNTELEKEVEEKTRHLNDMHDRLILGMADMVEGRDQSTGGHIKRTSELVKYLVTAMKQDPQKDISDKFCDAVIKAAPMHDLGKITVDDVVLRKPGRFTPEEYEIMKTHASNGAQIVKKLLANTEDDYFARIAENVAHYHHERVDGSGYPERKVANEIPFEARIMAIADVYDALVSKRCYKDSMSFEKANEIIMDGMGTQFDVQLQKYYLQCRPQFEAYYRNMEQSQE